MTNHREVLCAKCGYNLRALTTSIACPECGFGISLTLARLRQRPSLKFHWAISVSIVFALLHLAIAALLITMVLSSGRIEPGIILMLVDAPFWFIWGIVFGRIHIASDSSVSTFTSYFFYSAIGGTITYGLVGALLGFIIDYARFGFKRAASLRNKEILTHLATERE